MTTILHIKSSIRGEKSFSARTADAFLESYLETHPGDEVRTIDLEYAEIPEFDSRAVSGKYGIMQGREHTPEEAEAWKAVTALIDDFKSADKVVLSVPMWNFGIPYRLKHFFDVILQPGHTFSFSPQTGYKGLVMGKPALVIAARGGEYAAGSPAAAADFQVPYLEFVLKFMGFEDIKTVIVEPTAAGGPEKANERLAAAQADAQALAAAF